MIKKIIIYCFYLSFLYLGGASCSNSSISSGTGVGNPGETVVSILADSLSYVRSAKELHILSADSLPFTITTAELTVQKIVFNNDIEPVEEVGPFVFNALTGENLSDFNFKNLPYTTYRSLDFYVEKDSFMESSSYSIVLKGKFTYKETIRNFDIRFNIFGNSVDSYEIMNQPALLLETSNNIFQINMKAENWLNYIEFKNYLDYNELSLTSLGDLVIDSTTDPQIYKSMSNQIKQNIFKSGELYLISD